MTKCKTNCPCFQELISIVDTAEEKLVKSAKHAPIREKTLDTLSDQRQTRNKLVKQESLLQRHMKTIETFEELLKQLEQWLEEMKGKCSKIKESPVTEEPQKMNKTLQAIEVRNLHIIFALYHRNHLVVELTPFLPCSNFVVESFHGV